MLVPLLAGVVVLVGPLGGDEVGRPLECSPFLSAARAELRVSRAGAEAAGASVRGSTGGGSTGSANAVGVGVEAAAEPPVDASEWRSAARSPRDVLGWRSRVPEVVAGRTAVGSRATAPLPPLPELVRVEDWRGGLRDCLAAAACETATTTPWAVALDVDRPPGAVEGRAFSRSTSRPSRSLSRSLRRTGWASFSLALAPSLPLRVRVAGAACLLLALPASTGACAVLVSRGASAARGEDSAALLLRGFGAEALVSAALGCAPALLRELADERRSGAGAAEEDDGFAFSC